MEGNERITRPGPLGAYADKHGAALLAKRDALDIMREALDKLVPIPPSEWDAFAALTSHRRLTKREHFVQAGEATGALGFCVRGLLRLYYVTPDGSEYNKNFCARHDFVACYGALLQQVPAYFSIQALTDSELIMVCYSVFVALSKRHVCWERLGRVIAERLYLHKEMRERELLMLPAEARYQQFLQRMGPQAEQIPLYHVAGYLGITPVALSRIRRRLT